MIGDDGAVGVERFLAAAEDDRVAALEAQGGGVAGDVGAALVEEEHDAQRHADFLDPQAVGPDVSFDDLADRVDLAGDLLDAVAIDVDAFLIELQPLDQRRGGRSFARQRCLPCWQPEVRPSDRG